MIRKGAWTEVRSLALDGFGGSFDLFRGSFDLFSASFNGFGGGVNSLSSRLFGSISGFDGSISGFDSGILDDFSSVGRLDSLDSGINSSVDRGGRFDGGGFGGDGRVRIARFNTQIGGYVRLGGRLATDGRNHEAASGEHLG